MVAARGWFAARPSGTENIYKIYAESFKDQAHLDAIVSEAQEIVSNALSAATEVPSGLKDDHERHERQLSASTTSLTTIFPPCWRASDGRTVLPLLCPAYNRGNNMNATEKLHDLGQSLWLDNITRDLLTTGTLKRYIDELSVTGLTSNPTIFDHAIKNSTAYDASIRQKLKEGKSGEELFFELALEDSPRPRICFDRSGKEPTVWTDGCPWKYHLCWPTTRPKPSPRRKTSMAERDGPTSSSRSQVQRRSARH